MVGFLEDARPQAELGVCGQLFTSAEVCGETQTKPGWGGTAEAGEMLQFPPFLPWRALQQKGRHFCPVMCWRGKRNHSHRLRGFWAQMVLCSLWSCQTHLLFHPRPHVNQGGKCSSLLVFLPSHKPFLETRTYWVLYFQSCTWSWHFGENGSVTPHGSRLCQVLPCVIQACQEDSRLHSHPDFMQSAV